MLHKTSSVGPRSRVARVYQALLRLLPFEFRAEFGGDMQEAFVDEHDDVRSRRSRVETLRFWHRTVADFVRTAPRQHWDVLQQDVRVGIRHLTRHRGFAATAMLTLALGIGGSTSIFSVVYAVVLRPLEFPESDRVVTIGWRAEGDKLEALRPASRRDLATLREHATAFETIGGTRYDSVGSEKGSLAVPMAMETIVGGVGQSFIPPRMASASLFNVFGATTILGRIITEEDERNGATPVAVLSYATWTSHFGRDPGVIGSRVVRNLGAGRSTPVTIVGVLAPGAFAYPFGSSDNVPAWSSLETDPSRDAGGREVFALSIYARLAPGVSLDTARAQVAALTPDLSTELPQHLASVKPSLDVALLRDRIVGSAKTPLLAFLAAVSGLLLIACVNVTSLVLARAIARRQEFAARFALGARPLRVARQLLTESALLALFGGALGLALAWAGRRAFVAISPSMPRLEESSIGIPAVLFAFVGALLATCIAGILPALQASRRSVVDGLRRAGGAPGAATAFSRPLAALAAVEIALVLVLLAGTGLLVNSFARLIRFDVGFDSRSVVMFTIEQTLPPGQGASAPQIRGEQPVAILSERQRQMTAIHDEVIQRVSGVPGIAATALTGDDPFGPPYRYGVDIRIGEARTDARVALRVGSPTAVDALRLRMAAGRWFASSDRDGSPFVAVVNESLARRYWGERSPIGDQITYGQRSMEVVGVVVDVRENGARQDVQPAFYLSTLQMPPSPVMLVIRTAPGLAGVENVVAAELAQIGSGLKAHSARRPEHLWWRQLADARFLTLVVSVFSVLALTIALAGIHGILRFLVVQRTREMGIRKALGATRANLVRLVLGQALRFALPGCVAGLLLAAMAAPGLRTLLFGITPADPLTIAAVTLLLIAAVLVGAYFPARRAGAVDPALSLRVE